MITSNNSKSLNQREMWSGKVWCMNFWMHETQFYGHISHWKAESGVTVETKEVLWARYSKSWATFSNTCTWVATWEKRHMLVSEDAYWRGGCHWHYGVGREVQGIAALELWVVDLMKGWNRYQESVSWAMRHVFLGALFIADIVAFPILVIGRYLRYLINAKPVWSLKWDGGGGEVSIMTCTRARSTLM